MKKADMVIGDEYAVSQSQSGWGYGVKRVRIVEVGIERQTGHSYRPKSVADGVHVTYLDTDTGELLDLSALRTRYDHPGIIRAQNVKATWADYQAHLDKRKEVRDKRKADVIEEKNRLVDIAADANDTLGEKLFTVKDGYNEDTFPYLVASLDDLAELLAQGTPA